MEYITSQQAADKWGVSMRRVQAFLKDGRIEGAVQFNRIWLIPMDADKPKDGRVNNRRQPAASKKKPVIASQSCAEKSIMSNEQGQGNENDD